MKTNMNRRIFLSGFGQLFVAAHFAPRMFAADDIPKNNQRRSLSFSNDWIESLLVTAVREMPVEESILVNLSNTDLRYRVGADHGMILPWKSAMLRQCTVESAIRSFLAARRFISQLRMRLEMYSSIPSLPSLMRLAFHLRRDATGSS